MIRLILALTLALGACAASAPPAAPPAQVPAAPAQVPAAQAAPTEPSAAPAPDAPVPAPPSLLEAFDEGDLNRITITEVELDRHRGCAPSTGPTWIVSATDARGEGATCMGDGSAAPACVMYAGTTPEHVTDVMCKRRATARAVEVPTWAPRVLAAMRGTTAGGPWQVTPILDAVRPAVALVAAGPLQLFVAIRTQAGWQRTAEPVDQEKNIRLAAHRVVETTSLTGTTSFGVITSSYSGGSESGTTTTSFTVLKPTATGLAPAGTIQIGQFTWLLAAEDRRRYPKGATNLEERPHVDIQLAPRIDRDALVLDVARSKITKELKGPCERAPDGDEINAPCILVDLRAAAGRYKLVNADFQRVP